MQRLSFEKEIAGNKSLDTLPENHTTELSTEHASLQIRERGCFITQGVLHSPSSGKNIAVLYTEADIDKPKLTASHPMSPVGPYDGIGGQHGFPRWADYKEFPLNDGPNGQKLAAFQAKRSDIGPSLAKTFELTDSTLVSDTVLHNPSDASLDSSLGEHLYFSLADEEFAGLALNGRSLDELLGEGSEAAVKDGTPLYWGDYTGESTIKFPAGHEVNLTASVIGADKEGLGMLIWHRPGSESVCFEPTIGFDPENGGDGLAVEAYETVGLSTKIELL